ncbi:MAG: uracil-DNA glycosylase [Candidatus Omnitrophica bacterium]|nr:uracil-DNA glycosylase [Candidatus Omnitrophota bacterium]
MSENKEFKTIIDSLKRYMELESLSGQRELPIQRGQVSISGVVSGGDLSPLERLKSEVSSCTKCNLSKTRSQVVFGAGSPVADLMFVGEAPGMEEDLQGIPFVGRAGALLTKIIEAISLKRENVYIANVLKCRPPANRNPLPAEILICEGYLIKQIELIKPKVICALGKFAAQTLLRSEEPISRLRGTFYDYHGAKLMPTFHPAYLLRNSAGKQFVWEDMKKIQRMLNSK